MAPFLPRDGTGAATTDEFYFPFEFKASLVELDGEAVTEGTHQGQPGLFIEGYCAVFEPRDRGGDNWNLDLRKGSVTHRALEDYFKNNPIVLFEHGRDPAVGRKALGKTVEYRIDTTGVWVRDFLPRPEKNTGLLYDVYQKIKAGIYRTFSIAGRWALDAKQTIVEVSDIVEHSVVAVPMMGLATFTLAKALGLKAERGVDLEEAFMTVAEMYQVQGEKAGAMISAANKAKIKQAIDALEELLGLTDADDKPPGGSGGPNPMSGMPMGGTGKTKQQAENSQGGAERGSILNRKEGVYKMSKDEKQPGQSGEGEGEDKGTFLSADQFKTFQAMQQQYEKTQLEAEAKAVAEKKIKDEEDAARKVREAEEKRSTEIQTMAEEIAKTMRGGSRMQYSGDAGYGSSSQHIITPTQSYRGRFKENKGFSFLQFAKAGMQNREWNYIEDLKSADMEFKALQESVGSSGGYLVPVQQESQIEDILRAQAVVRQMPGVRVIPMTSDTMTMPRLTADATAGWTGELSTLTTSQLSFGQIRFVAHKLYALVQVSKEMMADSNPGVDQIIRESIAAALALKEDDAFLQGSGLNDTPLGIINTTNVGTFAYVTGTASAAPEYKALVKAAGIIRSNNARPNGVVMNSRVGDALLSVIDTSGQPIAYNAIGGYRWNDVQAAQGRTSNDPNQVQLGMLLGMTQGFANQLAVSATTSGTSSVVMGDWRRFIIAERQGIEVEIDRSVGFLTDSVYIKATKRVDCVVTIPQAFEVITAFSAIDIA